MVYIVFNLYNSDASRNQGKAWYVPAVDFIYRHLYLNMTYSRRITHVLPVCTIINPIFLTAVPSISVAVRERCPRDVLAKVRDLAFQDNVTFLNEFPCILS